VGAGELNDGLFRFEVGDDLAFRNGVSHLDAQFGDIGGLDAFAKGWKFEFDAH
jgi:hypothetical protein